MKRPQTPTQAVMAVREWWEGIDTARGIRASVATLLAVVVIVSMYAVPILAVGGAGTVLEDFEDNLDDWATIDGNKADWEIANHSKVGNGSLRPTRDDEFVDVIRLDFDDNTTNSIEFWYYLNGSTNDRTGEMLIYDASGPYRMAWFSYESNALRMRGETTIVNDPPAFEWMKVIIRDIDYDEKRFDVKVEDADGEVLGEVEDVPFEDEDPNHVNDVSRIEVATASSTIDWHMDHIESNAAESFVSGTVKDANGDPLEDAVVSVDDSPKSVVTGADGEYEFVVLPDEYNISASKFGYATETITVDVPGGTTVEDQNITLFSDEDVQLVTDTHLCHDETSEFEVFNIVGDGPGADRNDVTDAANVTSSDEDVLFVNNTSKELEATDNISINQVVTITARYENGTAEKNVLVGNNTVDNIDKFSNGLEMLVGLWGSVPCKEDGERPGGVQLTMRILFVATLLGAAVSRNVNGFAGVSAFAIVVMGGWLMDWVSLGMLLVAIAVSIFAGLNTAQLRQGP